MYVDRNHLTGIQEVEYLSQLKELETQENSLTSLKGVEKLKKLTLLDVSYNQLQNLNYIQNMESLTLLFASVNHLETVEELLTMKNLEGVGLSFNRITELPNLASLPKLDYITFGYNFLNEEMEQLKTKLPKAYFASSYGGSFDEDFKNQNLDYSIDFKEPVNGNMITSNTTRISGCIHMPAEKIQIRIEENLNDDDDFETYYLADVDQDGNFVFENLDLKKFAGGKCDMRITIGCKYDPEIKRYTGPTLHTYQLK